MSACVFTEMDTSVFEEPYIKIKRVLIIPIYLWVQKYMMYVLHNYVYFFVEYKPLYMYCQKLFWLIRLWIVEYQIYGWNTQLSWWPLLLVHYPQFMQRPVAHVSWRMKFIFKEYIYRVVCCQLPFIISKNKKAEIYDYFRVLISQSVH